MQSLAAMRRRLKPAGRQHKPGSRPLASASRVFGDCARPIGRDAGPARSRARPGKQATAAPAASATTTTTTTVRRVGRRFGSPSVQTDQIYCLDRPMWKRTSKHWAHWDVPVTTPIHNYSCNYQFQPLIFHRSLLTSWAQSLFSLHRKWSPLRPNGVLDADVTWSGHVPCSDVIVRRCSGDSYRCGRLPPWVRQSVGDPRHSAACSDTSTWPTASSAADVGRRQERSRRAPQSGVGQTLSSPSSPAAAAGSAGGGMRRVRW